MTATEITAFVVGFGGILASALTFLTSARNTDLEAVKTLLQNQRELIKTLQDELMEEREKRARLEQIVEDKDHRIDQLSKDLNEAYKLIRATRQGDVST